VDDRYQVNLYHLQIRWDRESVLSGQMTKSNSPSDFTNTSTGYLAREEAYYSRSHKSVYSPQYQRRRIFRWLVQRGTPGHPISGRRISYIRPRCARAHLRERKAKGLQSSRHAPVGLFDLIHYVLRTRQVEVTNDEFCSDMVQRSVLQLRADSQRTGHEFHQ